MPRQQFSPFLSFKNLDAAQPQAELFGSVWGVECVWGGSRKYSGSVWEVFGECLGSVW